MEINMRDRKFLPAVIVVAALAVVAVFPGQASAYVGPGPGMEMIPYFMSLLAWAGVAMGGVLLWPITSFLNRIRKPRTPLAANAETEQPSTPQPPA
jgi:hypothetical protein